MSWRSWAWSWTTKQEVSLEATAEWRLRPRVNTRRFPEALLCYPSLISTAETMIGDRNLPQMFDCPQACIGQPQQRPLISIQNTQTWTGPSDNDWKDVAAFHTSILSFDWQQYWLMMMQFIFRKSIKKKALKSRSPSSRVWLLYFTCNSAIALCFCRQGRRRGWVVSWQTLCFHWTLCC